MTKDEVQQAALSKATNGDSTRNYAAIIAGFEAAQAEGRGVVVVNGRLVEALHVEEAQRCIALHEAIVRISE